MKISSNIYTNFGSVYKTKVPLSENKNLKMERESIEKYIQYLQELNKCAVYNNTCYSAPNKNRDNIHLYQNKVIFRREDIFVPDELDKNLENLLSDAEIFYEKRSVQEFLNDEITNLTNEINPDKELAFIDYRMFTDLRNRRDIKISTRKTKNLNLEIAENLFRMKNARKEDIIKKFSIPKVEIGNRLNEGDDLFFSIDDLSNFIKAHSYMKLDIIPCEISKEDKKILENLKIIQKPHLN